MGAPPPLMVNPAPFNRIRETVSSVLPVFVSVTVCDADLPALTEPKFTLAGPTEICGLEPSTPEPDKFTVTEESPALLRTVRVPFEVPEAEGLNCKSKVTPW